MKLTQELLDEITTLLNRGAANYTVFLRLYQLSIKTGDASLDSCVRKTVRNDADIGGTEEIDVFALLSEMNELLQFAGDPGASPDPAALKSDALSNLLEKLRDVLWSWLVSPRK